MQCLKGQKMIHRIRDYYDIRNTRIHLCVSVNGIVSTTAGKITPTRNAIIVWNLYNIWSYFHLTTINNDFGDTLLPLNKRRERPAPLFTKGTRTEVARGGAPTVGGPRAELKLMDKGRQLRNFRRINRAVLLCVIEVLPVLFECSLFLSFGWSLSRISGARGTFY